MGAISAYLDLHGLSSLVNYISARVSPDAARLKPNKYLLDQAIAALGVDSSDCALIGDSITDVQARQAAGVKVIGYANKSDKLAAFRGLRADAIVERLKNLL